MVRRKGVGSSETSLKSGSTLARVVTSASGGNRSPEVLSELARLTDSAELLARSIEHTRNVTTRLEVLLHEGIAKIPPRLQRAGILATRRTHTRQGRFWAGGVWQPRKTVLFDRSPLRTGGESTGTAVCLAAVGPPVFFNLAKPGPCSGSGCSDWEQGPRFTTRDTTKRSKRPFPKCFHSLLAKVDTMQCLDVSGVSGVGQNDGEGVNLGGQTIRKLVHDPLETLVLCGPSLPVRQSACHAVRLHIFPHVPCNNS